MFVLVWVVSRLWLLPDLFAVLGFGWCVVWFAFVSGVLGFGVLCFALGGLLCWCLDVLPCRMVAVLNDLPILDGGVCVLLGLRLVWTWFWVLFWVCWFIVSTGFGGFVVFFAGLGVLFMGFVCLLAC